MFEPAEPLVAALRAASLDEVTDPRGRTYRIFADQTKSDREALAACIVGLSRERLTPADVAAHLRAGAGGGRQRGRRRREAPRRSPR